MKISNFSGKGLGNHSPSHFLSVIVGLGVMLTACNKNGSQAPAAAVEGPMQGFEDAVLTQAPNVPPPITRTHPTRVTVRLEIKEVEKELAPGVRYVFWTFGGSVPGQFIRVREGDLVEFHLSNHQDNKMPHNIDLHAVTGPGGGASASMTAPGHTSVFSFTVMNPGLFVYHCATAPVGMHIANGMYGLILVQPKAGLPKVDKEYYVMQSEFYTQGRTGQEGLQAFNMEKAVKEEADYVVFNGSMGAMSDDKAITAKVGEKVRLFVGNGGPGLVSSFHVIGEIFDRVYSWGGLKADQEQVQTILIPSGGSAIAEFGADFPGTYILVDHSIFRAFNKGALGMLKVTGATDSSIYSGKQRDEVYLAEGAAIQTLPIGAAVAPVTKLSHEEMMERGSRVYTQACAACHLPNGMGIPKAFPPLAKSDYLMADKNRAIDIILHGKSGPITVNGEQFNGVMPQLDLDDASAASVLTYIRNSFGNSGDAVTLDQVKARRR
ncbi:MAG: copper-containing nitrite reductase [Fibrobacterota bacterium]|nr:copper-containing nitrite reductase [Fibrobacterota bacterium]